MKYKVQHLQDNTYQVLIEIEEFEAPYFSTSTVPDPKPAYSYVVFQGSIADCEAYIRLKEGGYL